MALPIALGSFSSGACGQGGTCSFLGPDGFDGVPLSTGVCSTLRPCNAGAPFIACSQAPAPNLPVFPSINQSASYACYTNCLTPSVFPAQIQIGALVAPNCPNLYQSTVSFTVGGSTFSGNIVLKYSRTWKIIVPPGPGTTPQVGQVWRLLVNAETGISSDPAMMPCPVPPCAPFYPGLMHWVGHVDFACVGDPVYDPTATWSVVLSLHHLPGVISHNASTSPSRVVPAGSDHQGVSYHLVSPTNFTWFGTGVAPPQCTNPQGIYAQGIRLEPFGGSCTRREAGFNPNGGASIQVDAISFCGAPSGGNAGGWWDIQLGIIHSAALPAPDVLLQSWSCGQTWPGGYIPPNPPTPGSGILGLAIGSWNGVGYPYSQRLAVYWGCVNYNDPCTSGPPTNFTDTVTGVSTDDQGMDDPYFMEVFPFFQGDCCYTGFVMMDLQNAGTLGNVLWGGGFVPCMTVGLTWEP